ncbi:MAG: hypothetical protein HYT94_03275 [Parcubacteria group bacterium]|nr:hypothetical protein [Parcubacteria group bacterium]
MEPQQTHNEVASIPMSAPTPPKKMGKLRASYLLTIEGLELLKKDKQVLLFPVFSALASIVILAVFCLLYWLFVGDFGAMEGGSESSEIGPFGYGILLVLYLLLAFVATFFQAGLTAVVHARINGANLTFKEGMSAASRKSDKIFLWALLSATVGVMLGFISERSQWLGKLVASLLGAAWGIITFFIVPALILEEGKVSDAIKSSAGTFKKTWGETLLVNFSAGLFLALVALLGIVLSVAFAVLGAMFLPVPVAALAFIVLIILLIVFLVGIAVLSSALNSIFRVVLYEYAKSGHIADTFAPELILGALKKKE